MILHILLQTGGAGGLFTSLWPLLLILVVFYFFMIRPQAKRQKEQTKFIDEMQKGDNVVTASGIIGQINKVEGEIVTLEVANKTYIQVTKNSISKDMTESVHGKKS